MSPLVVAHQPEARNLHTRIHRKRQQSCESAQAPFRRRHHSGAAAAGWDQSKKQRKKHRLPARSIRSLKRRLPLFQHPMTAHKPGSTGHRSCTGHRCGCAGCCPPAPPPSCRHPQVLHLPPPLPLLLMPPPALLWPAAALGEMRRGARWWEAGQPADKSGSRCTYRV